MTTHEDVGTNAEHPSAPQSAEQIGTKSGLTRQEQIEKLLPAAQRMAGHVLQVGALYNKKYPLDTTPPEVLDAITVAVPYRQFMVMSGITMALVADHIAKQQAKATEAAKAATEAP